MSEATFAIPGVAVGAGIAAPLPTGTRVMTGPTTAGGQITAEAPDSEGIVTTPANERKVERKKKYSAAQIKVSTFSSACTEKPIMLEQFTFKLIKLHSYICNIIVTSPTRQTVVFMF